MVRQGKPLRKMPQQCATHHGVIGYTVRAEKTATLPMRDATRLPTTPRLQREYRTIEGMLQIWCANHHDGGAPCRDGLCTECADLLAYAGQRLANCPYGEAKPTCAKCPVHCYGRTPREQVRAVMRYAGPRMLWRHPWRTLLHVLDKLRPAELPPKLRGRISRKGETSARSRLSETSGQDA